MSASFSPATATGNPPASSAAVSVRSSSLTKLTPSAPAPVAAPPNGDSIPTCLSLAKPSAAAFPAPLSALPKKPPRPPPTALPPPAPHVPPRHRSRQRRPHQTLPPRPPRADFLNFRASRLSGRRTIVFRVPIFLI